MRAILSPTEACHSILRFHQLVTCRKHFDSLHVPPIFNREFYVRPNSPRHALQSEVYCLRYTRTENICDEDEERWAQDTLIVLVVAILEVVSSP